ncbi:protein disulfide isomerase-like 1-4 [Ipomoea triloba]|uniref:protein disulfide isomerase-like 1-4 n=1 Tax=Ipomoea triloba TaxID=35885 RepID=UPI00125D0D7B|nr:protein disulfide isomerase-like 1-4 [Ipomoea triloba]
MPRQLILLTLACLLLFSLLASPSLAKTAAAADDDDEDLTFLESDDENDGAAKHTHQSDPHNFGSDDEAEDDDEDFENYDDFEVPQGFGREEEEDDGPKVDDKDVVVLTDRNLSDFVDSNKYVMVEFYAPWCGHCKALAPEYAAAATELKTENVVLAKVDATEENGLAENYEVQGFPTILFFVDGEHKPYNGQRTKDAIVTWIKKKVGPGVYNITSTEDAERILTAENRVVLGFLDSLVGPSSEEFAAASKLEDNINFFQTDDPNIAKLFHIEPSAKRPSLVLLKKEAEKVTHYDGIFTKSAILGFISANKLPLVTTFTRESAPSIFDSPIKKQVMLFTTSNDTEKFFPVFQDAARYFKGKLIFVYIKIDDEDVGRPVANYFGVEGDTAKIIGFSGLEDAKKYIFDGEITVEKIKEFAANVVEDKLKPFYKSDPIPETNEGDVKIVVGNNFDEIVLDESKDVLLEIYAPWCGHCQALEPTYNKLAKHLRGIESLVIAKMDGTTNEHPKAKAEGFPTILFFPAGNKSSDPIAVDSARTVVAFYKFIKKHAAIPFKLQKPSTSTSSEKTEVKEDIKSSSGKVKDEL